MVTGPHSRPVRISSAVTSRRSKRKAPDTTWKCSSLRHKITSGGERASALWQLHGLQGIQLFLSLLFWAVNWHTPIPRVFLVKNSRLEVLPQLCYQVTWKTSLRTNSTTKADIYLVFLFLFSPSPFIPPIPSSTSTSPHNCYTVVHIHELCLSFSPFLLNPFTSSPLPRAVSLLSTSESISILKVNIY